MRAIKIYCALLCKIEFYYVLLSCIVFYRVLLRSIEVDYALLCNIVHSSLHIRGLHIAARSTEF